MQNITTLNDLILFAYSDPDASDEVIFDDLTRENHPLKKDYKAILKIKNYFQKIKVGPSESTIKNILNYSRALSVAKTKSAGNISLLLN